MATLHFLQTCQELYIISVTLFKHKNGRTEGILEKQLRTYYITEQINKGLK